MKSACLYFIKLHTFIDIYFLNNKNLKTAVLLRMDWQGDFKDGSNSSKQSRYQDSHLLHLRGLSTALRGKIRNIDQTDVLYRTLASELGSILFSALQQMCLPDLK